MVSTVIKATHVVKPAEETPTTIMYASEVDQITLLTHVTTIYFYPSHSNFSFETILQNLKHSLSKALVIFYPFAGRLQWNSRNRLEINCNALGAHLIEAETDARIDDFAPHFAPTPALRALLPDIDEDYDSRIEDFPNAMIQLTKFSCGGVAIGTALSHILADGQSGLHFVSELARINRGEEIDDYPLFLDRTILRSDEDLPPAGYDDSDFKQPPLLIGSSSDAEERLKDSEILMLKLSKNQIEKLRNQANEKMLGYTDRNYSRFDAMTAHMWRSACKARKHKHEQPTVMRVVVGFRNRVKPPLPKRFFGNAVIPVNAYSTSGEITSRPLSYAANKIRAATDKVTDEYVKASLTYLKNLKDLAPLRYYYVDGETKGAFFGNPNLRITSWNLPRSQGMDFGWGEEMYFGPGEVGFDGKCYFLSGRDEEGSAIIALRLQVEHIEDFKKFFYEDI